MTTKELKEAVNREGIKIIQQYRRDLLNFTPEEKLKVGKRHILVGHDRKRAIYPNMFARCGIVIKEDLDYYYSTWEQGIDYSLCGSPELQKLKVTCKECKELENRLHTDFLNW